MTRRTTRSTRSFLLRLLPALVALAVLVPTAASALPVDDFGSYQPQTGCSPKAKPGTLKLAAWLQKTYQGSGSLGISRSCNDGGVSEHKEGRAFDWEINVHSARDRGYAAAFLERAFATDAAGNKAALARRMGIMYIIWNDHIYASYDHFSKRAYKNSGCTKLATCGDTLRHRDHMHISLTRAGGAGTTSFYTKKAPATHTVTPKPSTPKPSTPAPKPTAPKPTAPKPTKPVSHPAPTHHEPGVLDLRRVPYVAINVRADGTASTTSFKIEKGATYTVTTAGLFSYGSPRQVADAACVWSPGRKAFVPGASRAVRASQGSLDLTVNGFPVYGSTCSASHVYTATVTARATRTVTLKVRNTKATYGALVVTLSRRGADVSRALPSYPSLRPAPAFTGSASRGYGLVADTVAVPADGSTVSTGTELKKGVQYRLTVTGTAGLGYGVSSDGDCLQVGGSWYEQASLDLRQPDQDHGQLYVDGAPFVADTGSCASHVHSTTFTAQRDATLSFALWDPIYSGGADGELAISVQRLTPLASPTAAQTEAYNKRGYGWTQTHDWFQVSSASGTGAVSSMRLKAGERVSVLVRGTQRSGDTTADASCVLTSDGWATRDPEVALDQDVLDLWVDGQPVTWRALGRSGTCSDDQHSYVATFTATHNGPLRLAVLDLDYRDNRGTFDVTLLRG